MDNGIWGGPMTRRDALQRLLGGAAGLAVAGLGSRGWAAAAPAPGTAAAPAAKAKAVIQIWMWGGPSQLDTFDPKPEAGEAYTGPLSHPIETNVPGIRICELLPLLAKQADKYSILRSLTHRVNAHETASYIVQTGHQPGRQVFPCAGAVVSLFRGVEHGYTGLVPPYVVLTTPQGRFSEAGFLGLKYKPFATGGDPNAARFAVEGFVAEGITDERQLGRRELLATLDTFGRAMVGNPQLAKMDQSVAKAYDLMLGDARQIFDLSEEKPELREAYGRSKFGQSCLMARRLVERGVPYVTINYAGWDTHKRHFETMRQKLPELDKGMATLLTDLSERGLLDSTIVWWSGEFGRTPRVMWEEPWNGGRGHYGNCFCAVLAGGGFKGGQVVGKSDATGSEPAESPVYPQDMLRAMYRQLGIDPDGALYNPMGLDLKVMPPAEQTAGAEALAKIV